jgi:hypothetical protein
MSPPIQALPAVSAQWELVAEMAALEAVASPVAEQIEVGLVSGPVAVLVQPSHLAAD